MGNYISHIKSSKRSTSSNQDSNNFKNLSDQESNSFTSTSVTNNNPTSTTSISIHSNKKLKNKNSFDQKMAVVLKPTVKQTATVIFLHGLGDTGHGWSTVFASMKKPHIKYIFPHAPIRPVTLNGGFEMNAWFDILGLRPDATQDEEGIQKSSQLLLNLVEEEMKNGIPSDRIYIGGFSQGGATALYTALTSSLRFAGVIALSTWLPLHHRFPAHLKQFDNKFSTPFLQCHGDCDPMVPLEWSQMTVKLLQTIGFTSVQFKTYRGLSHSSSQEEMDDVEEFINKITSA